MNYWKQHESIHFYVLYAYIDTKEHLADQIFRQMGIRIHKKVVMDKPGLPYQIVFCWVRKASVGSFITAMDELERKLLIFGYKDYPGICEDLAGVLGA